MSHHFFVSHINNNINSKQKKINLAYFFNLRTNNTHSKFKGHVTLAKPKDKKDNFYLKKKSWVLFDVHAQRQKPKARKISLPTTTVQYSHVSEFFTELRGYSYYSAVMSPKHCVVISGIIFCQRCCFHFFWILLGIREKGLYFLFFYYYFFYESSGKNMFRRRESNGRDGKKNRNKLV